MELPRPGVALTICSLAAILFCTALCAACVGAMLHPWGVRGLAALLLLPGLAGLALTQYAATFQAKRHSAATVARLYSFGGGFMLVALACLLLDVAGSGEHPSWPVLGLVVALVVFAAWGRVGGRLNRQWTESLRQAEEQFDEEAEPPRRAGPAWIGLSAAVVFVAAAGASYFALGPKLGEHLAASAAPLRLPEGASDVCYWIYSGETVFEFSVSEQVFLAWAGEQIGQRREEFDGIEEVAESQTVPVYLGWAPQGAPPHEVVIEQGYHYGWRESNRSVQYAYDSVSGRAYYCSTARQIDGADLGDDAR